MISREILVERPTLRLNKNNIDFINNLEEPQSGVVSFARRPLAKLEGQSSNDAFRLERYDTPINKNSLRDDLISYLGEYRFGLPKYSYQLKFENGHLLDPNKKVSLEDMAHKSIGTRLLEGRPTYRELAEKEGIQALDHKLAHAKTGDTIIWMSPPGDKNEGYGDYGFVFYGKVGDGILKKDISMTAIRVNGSDLAKYNKAFQMLTDIKNSYTKPEEFISNPQVLSDDLPEGYVDAILGLNFGFRNSDKEQKRFSSIIKILNPLIEDFIELSDYASLEDKEKAFFSLENYALKLKKDYEELQMGERIIFSKDSQRELRLQDIVGNYGHKPPAVAGSCGSTSKDSSGTSSNIMNKLSGINSLFKEGSGTCKDCNESASDDHYHCPEKNCKKKYSSERDKSPEQRTKQCGCGFKFGC